MNVDVVFGIIFAILVLAFVLLFGSNQIAGFFCLSSDAQVANAISDLRTETETVSVLAEGSAKTFQARIPGDALLCAIDPNHPEPDVSRGWDPPPDVRLIISTPGHQDADSNVWARSCGRWQAAKLPRLVAAQNFCTSSSLVLRSTGTAAAASLR